MRVRQKDRRQKKGKTWRGAPLQPPAGICLTDDSDKDPVSDRKGLRTTGGALDGVAVDQAAMGGLICRCGSGVARPALLQGIQRVLAVCAPDTMACGIAAAQ